MSDLVQLSKTVSHALRHEPKEYNLNPDDEGWVELSDLVTALRHKGWVSIEEKHILSMIDQSEKKRHQVLDGKVRALYGHSLDNRIVKQSCVPPEILYHGTNTDKLSSILSDGLRPMQRQYVHLSEEINTAKEVARRRNGDIVIIQVDAAQAHNDGKVFYREGKIWLTDFVPSEYLIVL